jgi:hypothetical protein
MCSNKTKIGKNYALKIWGAPFWVIQDEMKADKLTIQEMVLDDITFGCFGSHMRSLGDHNFYWCNGRLILAFFNFWDKQTPKVLEHFSIVGWKVWNNYF